MTALAALAGFLLVAGALVSAGERPRTHTARMFDGLLVVAAVGACLLAAVVYFSAVGT